MTVCSDRAAALIRDLLDPEALGLAVSAEVRDRARECLGMRAVESRDGADDKN